MSRYVLAAGWQDEDPWPSGAHWEVGWDDERVTFWARLFEDYGPAEPEDELLPSDYEPISSHGERDLSNPDDRFILRIEVAHAARSSDDFSETLLG